MTTQQWNNVPDMSTTAAFQAWGGAMSAALTAVGIPMTADTGQINWTTVAQPAAGQPAGYEIRYLNDALNATYPVVIKIEYGSSTTAARPAIWITIGTGSDGVGNITGAIFFARTQIGLVYTNDLGTYPNYLVGDGSGFVLVPWATLFGSTIGGAAVLILERSRDSAGNITSDGFTFIYRSAGNSPAQYKELTCTYLLGSPGVQSVTGVSMLHPVQFSAAVSATDGVNVYLGQHISMSPARRWYSKYILSYGHVDIGAGATFSATHLGAAHTFLATDQGAFGPRTSYNNAGDYYACLAMLWE